MRPGSGSVLDDPVARQRLMEEYWRRQADPPPKPPYSPRLRRDQIRELYYLKAAREAADDEAGAEAIDRLLEEHGGAEAILARGIERFHDRGEERPGPRAVD